MKKTVVMIMSKFMTEKLQTLLVLGDIAVKRLRYQFLLVFSFHIKFLINFRSSKQSAQTEPIYLFVFAQMTL